MERERSRATLLDLAALDKSDFLAALRQILRADARALGLARVNFWSLRRDPLGIVCEQGYLGATDEFESGAELFCRDYPHYFRALQAEKVIAADDARADARTSEFTRSYLEPLGITSMMDVPVWVGGALAGVLCHEHVGPARRFSPDEQEFALSIAQMIATALEARERGRAEALAIDNARLYREAREAVRQRDEFLSIASHELYTPLTSLQLSVQSLRAGIAGRHAMSDESFAHACAVAERQVRRLTVLIEDLLSVTRIQSGRLDLQIADADLAEVVREVAGELAERAEQARSPLVVREGGPAVGRLDRARIEQVVTNLLSNAIKFGAGRPIEVAATANDATVRLTVADRGIGIDVERLPHVFDRFERAVSPRAFGGLGLGLYIARKIVEAHGGTIGCESVPGEGSTFTVDLPAAGPAPGSG